MMKRLFRYVALLTFIVLLSSNTNGQNITTTDFYSQLKNYNLSTILTAKKFLAEDREGYKERIVRPAILGFIGEDYKRFFIHFTSIKQDAKNPYAYVVAGKTMVEDNICFFQGTITVQQASIYKSEDIPAYKQGYATCDVILYEDKKQPSTGIIKGTMKSKFLIDDKDNFRYDGLMFSADGFANNQFVGSWTSYKTNLSKRCHWGDYRIPESGDLDIGAGEFSVNEKYIKNGWLSYVLENMMPNKAIVKPVINEKLKYKKWWE